jgi:hypothetical protein
LSLLILDYKTSRRAVGRFLTRSFIVLRVVRFGDYVPYAAGPVAKPSRCTKFLVVYELKGWTLDYVGFFEVFFIACSFRSVECDFDVRAVAIRLVFGSSASAK